MTTDVSIHGLPAAAALADADELVVVQNVSSVLTTGKTTLALIKANILAAVVGPDLGVVTIANHAGAYTMLKSDRTKIIRKTDGVATNVTISTHAVEAVDVGTVYTIRQVGAGQQTLVYDGSITMNIPTGYLAKTRANGSTIMLQNVADNEWDLTGDLATA